ncbi:hypothetical protein TNCV_2186981 [Trichonephila clavipes]|nr:hypothetical protein TNCV_2186981 [Trichonephila clavipes]
MTSETVEVARIALRLPPFWKSNVRLLQYPTTKSFGNSCSTINSATESIAMPPSSCNVNISMLKFMDLTPEMIFQLVLFTLDNIEIHDEKTYFIQPCCSEECLTTQRGSGDPFWT